MRVEMTYTNRILIAAAGSLLLHLLAAGAYAYLVPRGTGPAPLPLEPLVVNLEPPREMPSPEPLPEVRRLIDVATPSETPPPERPDLIAETHSRAQDTELRAGEDEGPVTLEPDEFDALARVPEPQPVEQPSFEAPREAAEPERPAEAPPQPPPAPPKADSFLPSRAEEETAPALEPLEDERREVREEERMQVAQAMPEAQANESASMGRTRGLHNAVKEKGFTNFAALQDDIAPYLKEIRDRVERQWRHMLVTRYSGTSPTKATIDCAISSDGRLISVTVVGTPDDRVYAALCRQAVEKAGPFAPFPFEVPDLYRSKNLEIRWTFGFL